MALDNVQIEAMFTNPRNDRHIRGFGGVYLQDDLNGMTPEPKTFYIVNFLRNQDPVKEVGHWVAIYNMRDGYILYIDPFGQAPPESILAFMKRARRKDGRRKDTIYSTTDLQDYNSDYCGYYVVLIIKEMLKGRSLLSVMSDLSLLDTKLNEHFIKHLISSNYYLKAE